MLQADGINFFMDASVAALRLLSAEVLVNSKHVNVPNMQRVGMHSGAQLE
jgi:hypothetical protein